MEEIISEYYRKIDGLLEKESRFLSIAVPAALAVLFLLIIIIYR